MQKSIFFLFTTQLMVAAALIMQPIDLCAAPVGSAAGEFKAVEGFEVDLVHDISAAGHGSWVSLCVDSKDRIIASDQYGKLYRVTLAADGDAEVEELDINIGLAQGMLYAFDSLYININANKNALQGTDATGPGVYRLTDTNGDDQFDSIEHLVKTSAQNVGEHGPHALILSPDKKQIYFCCGNQVAVPDSVTKSRVPRHWNEDHLLGRMPDARGHMRGKLAPGGWICKMDPDGSNQELIATGFRNEYDIAFNQVGDLFTYDADMEWDIGSPWYRPTRVNHVISGAEFGWRNGTGKWPDYYGDSFGAVVNVGPGSPTGITFGFGAKFPAKYQRALFINDWSYGIIYAVHMQPTGATYAGEVETFLTAAPMAVTDIVVHPDGNIYFAVGGRKTQSSLYRIRYTGSESTTAASPASSANVAEARNLRQTLERLHGSEIPRLIDTAISNLGNPDRSIRFAARIGLEHQPIDSWREAALQVKSPQARITAAYALARVGSKQDQPALVESLCSIDFHSLKQSTKLELLRAHNLVWIRLGDPSASQREKILAQLDSQFPGKSGLVNRELAASLVYLNAPGIVPRVVDQIASGGAQEDQIHYAFCLREVDQGWTPETRRAYFQWFHDIASARGGASFIGFLTNIRAAALDKLTEQQKDSLGELSSPTMPSPKDPYADLKPRDVVAEWTVEKVQAELAKTKIEPDFATGRMLTSTAQCFKCHRFAGQGGIQGPDLTAVGGRFNEKDLLVSIIDPNVAISDQYQATQFLTEDGVVTGRVANLSGDTLRVVENMLAPGDFTDVKVDEILERQPSRVSMMPGGLLNTFTIKEIGQMLAYLRSGGRADHEVYSK